MELGKYIMENQAGIEGNDYYVAWKPNRYWVFRGDKLPKDPSYTKQFETPFYPISRELLVRMGADDFSPLTGFSMMKVSWSKHVTGEEVKSLKAEAEALREKTPAFQYDTSRKATTGFDLENRPSRSYDDHRAPRTYDGSGMGHTW